jgi:general stress protein 13
MKKGDIVKGRITGIKPYGAFVKIDENIDGLVHISEISDGYVKNIEEYFKIGDVVKLLVLDINANEKVSLSYKKVNLTSKKKYVKIHLKVGFEPLKTMLPIWIANYRKSDKN